MLKLFLSVGLCAVTLVLTACGGGGSSSPSPTNFGTSFTNEGDDSSAGGGIGEHSISNDPIYVVLTGVPQNHELSPMDMFTIRSGIMLEHGNVEFSCPVGGADCVVRVTSDGGVEYKRDGGTPSARSIYASLIGIPSNHGIPLMATFSFQPGTIAEHGNVEFWCPSNGKAVCVVRVSSDGRVEYRRSGGRVIASPIYVTVSNGPANHGLLTFDKLTVQPGTTVEHGNVEISCPVGGPACIVRVSVFDSLEYQLAGGVPLVEPIYVVLLNVPRNHGISPSTTFTIQPGNYAEHGNVEFRCLTGEPACVIRVTTDGSVEYKRDGGFPWVIPVIYSRLPGVPLDHGLSRFDVFSVQPGTTVKRGNIKFSCPDDGRVCVVRVTVEKVVQYKRNGGTPSLELVLAFPLPDEIFLARHFSTSQITLVAADVRHSPIYTHGGFFFDEYLQVGIDQGRQIGGLPLKASRGDTKIRYGQLYDGIGLTSLEKYFADLGMAKAKLYTKPLQVRVIGAASTRDIKDVMTSVQLVNAALPENAKMQMGSTLPDLSLSDSVDSNGGKTLSGKELNNTIHIEFIPSGEFYSRYVDATAWSWLNYTSLGPGQGHGYIQFNRDADNYNLMNSRLRVILLAHEILHTLGFEGHVSSSVGSILNYVNSVIDLQQPRSILYPADREALQMLYRNLNNGDDFEDLGPWATTSLHIVGNDEYTHFGVALRNGYAEPWGYGYLPQTNLSTNQSLSGRVTWTGVLLGLTPDAEAVAGEAEIGVNLETLVGNANFTKLESWAANTAPGDEGTGTQWLDGDLSYTINVSGNTFRETGGDDGRLTGIFTGRQHQGTTGTLVRTDLTAAFGASRE